MKRGRLNRPKGVIKVTNKEFWQLKTGDVIYDTMRDRVCTIKKRTVENEILGFVISKKKDKFIYSDKKYVQLTVTCNNGFTYYYDSTRKDCVSRLVKIDSLQNFQKKNVKKD